MKRDYIALAVAACLTAGASLPAVAAKPPSTWDNLVLVKSKRMDMVYLSPGADFRAYSKVMLDPVEIAFEKDWRRDYNRSRVGVSERITERELQDVIEDARKGADGIFAKGIAQAGYPVVTEPGPDVIRLKIAVINVEVTAPDTFTSARSHTYAEDAGEATFVVEARDSTSGAILGRAIDRALAGDTTMGRRSQVFNRADFRQLASRWAKNSVAGLNELKSMSPINTDGLTQR